MKQLALSFSCDYIEEINEIASNITYLKYVNINEHLLKLMTNLQNLHIYDYDNTYKKPISYLNKLQSLNISTSICDNDTELPNISYCSILSGLHIKSLKLNFCIIDNNEISKLTKLKHLKLLGCEKFNKETIIQLTNLQSISMDPYDKKTNYYTYYTYLPKLYNIQY